MQVFLAQLQALLNAYEQSEADSTFYPLRKYAIASVGTQIQLFTRVILALVCCNA